MKIFSLLFFLKISSFHLIALKEKDILSSDYLCDKPGCPYLGISVLLECEKQKQKQKVKEGAEQSLWCRSNQSRDEHIGTVGCIANSIHTVTMSKSSGVAMAHTLQKSF